MLPTPVKKHDAETGRDSLVYHAPRYWYLDWPLYAILAVAIFLHFFQLQTTEFDFDQADLFRLAREAITNGLIPLSSNQASIQILHQPIFEYLLLPAAAISANPLGGAITVSLFTTAAAILTYCFTYRYFGRFPAIVAGLLSATSYTPLRYARFIWQPNVIPFFMVLFAFAIYRGAVERKKGWFLPAVILIAIIYQLHSSTVLALAALFLLAVVMAPTTIRWLELAIALGAFILLLLPSVLLEFYTHFSDIKGTIAFAKLPAYTNGQALKLYQALIFPYAGLHPAVMKLLGWCLVLLLVVGFIVATKRLFWPDAQPSSIGEHETINRWLQRWNALRCNPERVAMLLLLTWQLVPFADLIHHSISLHMQYLLLFLPGPFILMGLAMNEFVQFVQHLRPHWTRIAQISAALVSAVLIIGQLTGTTAYLLKMTGGHYNDRTVQNLPYINDVNSMWNATRQADQLAQTQHINHIYMSMDTNIQSSMTYLGETLHTPTTVFGDEDCLLLPPPSAGPAVYLIGPYIPDMESLLQTYANVKLVAQPARLGGQPFHLYIVTPKTSPETKTTTQTGTSSLTLQSPDITSTNLASGTIEVTHWTVQRNASASPRTLYNYQMNLTAKAETKPIQTTCATTALQQGDQLITAFPLAKHQAIAGQQTITGSSFDIVPETYHPGPLKLTSYTTLTINQHPLIRNATGKTTLTLPAPPTT